MRPFLVAALIALRAASPAAAAEQPPADVPSAQALWSQFHAGTDPVGALESMAVLNDLFDYGGGVRAADCAAAESRLAEALRRVPVSLALWYAEMECAEAAADAPRQARAEAHFSNLSRHALSRQPTLASEEPPIPIVSEADAWLLARALDFEVVHAYYRMPLTGPHVRLQMTVQAAEAGTQRIWVLDAVESWRPLFVPDPEALSPAFAWRFRSSYMTPADGESESSAGLRLQRLVKALAVRHTSDVPRQLEAMARTDFGAARAFFELCVVRNPGVCSHAAIDSLLRYAEAGSAEALWLVATAYAEGRGVPRDAKAAAALLDRADVRLGAARATLAAAREWLLLYRLPALPPILEARIKRLADAGDAEAAELLLAQSLNGLALRRVSPRQMQRYADAAQARDLRIRANFAALLERSGSDEGLQALQTLAQQGEPSAAAALLDSRRGRAALADQPALRLRLHRLAGLHGRASSSATVARHLLRQGEQEAAQDWFYIAFIQGDIASGARAAELALEARGLRGGSPESWVRILDLVLEYEDSPLARRVLAEMLLQGEQTVPSDAERAGQLLRSRLGASDPQAERVLASALLQGRIPAQRGEDGEAMLRALAEAGDPRALDSLALLMAAGRVQGSATEALALWRRAAQGGDTRARNNLARTLCTSPDEAYRDHAAGLAEAQVLLGSIRDHDSLALDTVASCEAASGDFAAAGERLRALIALLRLQGIDRSAVARFEDRLAGFERGQPHVEDPHSDGPLARPWIGRKATPEELSDLDDATASSG